MQETGTRRSGKTLLSVFLLALFIVAIESSSTWAFEQEIPITLSQEDALERAEELHAVLNEGLQLRQANHVLRGKIPALEHQLASNREWLDMIPEDQAAAEARKAAKSDVDREIDEINRSIRAIEEEIQANELGLEELRDTETMLTQVLAARFSEWVEEILVEMNETGEIVLKTTLSDLNWVEPILERSVLEGIQEDKVEPTLRETDPNFGRAHLRQPGESMGARRFSIRYNREVHDKTLTEVTFLFAFPAVNSRLDEYAQFLNLAAGNYLFGVSRQEVKSVILNGDSYNTIVRTVLSDNATYASQKHIVFTAPGLQTLSFSR